MESDSHSQPKRKAGRPSKGPRETVWGKVPTPLARRFKADAEKRDISQADLLAEVLRKVYGDEREEMALSA
ncbi:hypothetical protein [Nonomuraea diastatica]|uniref:Uncharacterized protein n=1 Tax=Nonomuraea diastatica TaxID=1848329 RepID=A0A4R4VWH7_9ACTN|nr:hypothetical protein [Nonomuraea diastatica]TDD04790.1 hypothetical protein E1294_49930 [Nonomuraea diastatica]